MSGVVHYTNIKFLSENESEGSIMKIFLLLLIGTTALLSQTKVYFFSGLNAPSRYNSIHQSSSLHSYWHNGIIVGLGMERQIAENFTLNPSIEFNYYPFRRYTSYRMMFEERPEQIEPRYPGSRLLSSTGESSHTLRIMMDARYFETVSNSVSIYLSTGVGLVRESMGAVRMNMEDETHRLYTTTVRSSGATYIVHSAGIGIRKSITASVELETGVKYFSNYSDRLHYSFSLGVFYRL